MSTAARRVLERGRSAVSPVLQMCKPLVRDAVANGLARIGVTQPARFARSALTVVTFHRVLPEQLLRKYPLPGLAVTPEQMKIVVRELVSHFHCLPLIEAYRAYVRGDYFPKPLMAITLDDGALDNFQYARPVLEECGVRGSFYIPVESLQEQLPPWHDILGFGLMGAAGKLSENTPTSENQAVVQALEAFDCSVSEWRAAAKPQALQGLCERSVEAAKLVSASERSGRIEALLSAVGHCGVPGWAGLMSWEQVRQLSQAGHEIGSHSLTHPLLPDCESSQIASEIADSRQRLQELVGCEIASFCYPNGSYDKRCIEQAEAAGYECSVTTRWGLNRRATPAHQLRRCDMDFQRLEDRAGLFSPERLMYRLSGLQPGLR